MTLILQGTDNSVSSPAVQGGTAGTTTGVYYPASNQLALATNGAQALLIDSSGNLMIGGATTPKQSSKFTNYGRYWTGSGNSSGDAEVVWSNYASATAAWSLSVRQDVGGANNDLKILTLSSSGVYQGIALQLSQTTGNLTFGQSNAGIVFNNSSALTNSTLNDYEVGTWTPTFSPASGSLTAYTSAGRYVKIGNQVILFFCVRITTVGTASGQGTVGGLPFTSQTATAPMSRAGEFIVRETWSTGVVYQGWVISSSTQAGMADLNNGSLSWNTGYGYEGTMVYNATF